MYLYKISKINVFEIQVNFTNPNFLNDIIMHYRPALYSLISIL